jgi:hypothetical protein
MVMVVTNGRRVWLALSLIVLATLAAFGGLDAQSALAQGVPPPP